MNNPPPHHKSHAIISEASSQERKSQRDAYQHEQKGNGVLTADGVVVAKASWQVGRNKDESCNEAHLPNAFRNSPKTSSEEERCTISKFGELLDVVPPKSAALVDKTSEPRPLHMPASTELTRQSLEFDDLICAHDEEGEDYDEEIIDLKDEPGPHYRSVQGRYFF